jgi:hypothetical protein
LTLIRARAYAATITGIGRRAALGLALIILKHEKRIGAGFKGRAIQRLIGSVALPIADSIRAC